METDALDTPDPEPKAPRNPIGQILTHEGRSLALVDLGSSFSDTLRAAWREAGAEGVNENETTWFCI